MSKTVFVVKWTHLGKLITKEYDNLADADKAYKWLKQKGGDPEKIKVRVDKKLN